MNDWQITRQIVKLLQGATWPDSPGLLVFSADSVFASGRDPASVLLDRVAPDFPFAVVGPGVVTNDSEVHERIATADFVVTVFQRNNADMRGSSSVVGANRASQGTSDGRGLLEIVESALVQSSGTSGRGGRFVDSIHAFQGSVTGKSDARAVPELGDAVSMQSVTITATNATHSRTYHPVTHFAAANGSGQSVLTWLLPPTRWDSYSLVVRRSAAGGVAPATVTDGTGVTISGTLPITVTPSGLSPGVYIFSVFASYDETNVPTSTAQRYSSARSSQPVTVS